MVISSLKSNSKQKIHYLPLSTLCFGNKNGYWWSILSVGHQGPSRDRKNNSLPPELIKSSKWSWHLTTLKASFLGKKSSMNPSIPGKESNSLARMPFWTEDLSWVTPDMDSFSSNFLNMINFLYFWYNWSLKIRVTQKIV